MIKMKPIPESYREELLKTFDYNEETGELTRLLPRHLSGKRAGSINDQGYVLVSFKNQSYRAHRLVWLMVTGKSPKFDIDHRDGNRSNNAFKNLREVAHSNNQANMKSHRDNPCGVVGVNFYKRDQKWRAYICRHGKIKHLGFFDKFEDAVEARRVAAIALKGNFANELSRT